MKNGTAVVHSDGLGGSTECAWFDPFMDLTLDYSDGTPRLVGFLTYAGSTGLVAHPDGHRVGERKPSCPTRDVSKSTRGVAN